MIKWNVYNYKSLPVFSYIFHNLKYPLFSANDVLNALVIVNVNLKLKLRLRKLTKVKSNILLASLASNGFEGLIAQSAVFNLVLI